MQDENKKKLRERVKKVIKKKTIQSSDNMMGKVSGNSSGRSEKSIKEDFPEGLPEELIEDFPEGLPEELLEDFPEGIPEELVGRLAEDGSGDTGRSDPDQSYRRQRRSGEKKPKKEKRNQHKLHLTGKRSGEDKKRSQNSKNRDQEDKNQGNAKWKNLIQKTDKIKIRKQRGAERISEKQKRLRIVIAVCAAAVVLLLIIFGIASGLRGRNSVDSDTDTSVSTITSSEIRHFSFPALLSDEASVDNDGLTVSEFTQILQDLYDHNYILVDIYSLADVTTNEDGTTLYAETTLDIPAGKIPFVLSERDVSYPLARTGNGYPSRMLLDESGNITVEYQQLDGTVVTGAYDIVPILENFLAVHPDFSYNNARGVLALTGYNGILGYRTTESLGLSQDEGNMYAQYGIFDVNQERENCAPVIEALQQKGWHFACNGNNNCSYGAEYALVQNDIDTWMEDVSSLIGGTDLMIFPEKTDMGPWSEYTDQNQKYLYMESLGFRYYCIEDSVNPFWVQIRDSYVRQGIKEIDTYEDYQEIMQS